MAGYTEATRQLRMHAEIASLELEDLATSITTEMMVMRLACNLISQGFAGHRDGCEPVAFQQRANVPVYGRDAQPFHLSLRRRQHLFRRERTISPKKSLSNCRFLTCIARLCGQSLLLIARIRSRRKAAWMVVSHITMETLRRRRS